jgi:hypothetical protein
VGLNSLKSLNLTNGYPNKNKKKKKKKKNNNNKNNNKVKSKPLELRSRVKRYIKIILSLLILREEKKQTLCVHKMKIFILFKFVPVNWCSINILVK